MSVGHMTETTKGTEHDPIVEFREGVELLKNEYLEKALVRLRRAYESDKHNPYYISFLGLSSARAEEKWDQAMELCEMAVQLKRTEIQFHMNLVEVYALAGWREKALHKLDGALRLDSPAPPIVQTRIMSCRQRHPEKKSNQSYIFVVAFFLSGGLLVY